MRRTKLPEHRVKGVYFGEAKTWTESPEQFDIGDGPR